MFKVSQLSTIRKLKLSPSHTHTHTRTHARTHVPNETWVSTVERDEPNFIKLGQSWWRRRPECPLMARQIVPFSARCLASIEVVVNVHHNNHPLGAINNPGQSRRALARTQVFFVGKLNFAQRAQLQTVQVKSEPNEAKWKSVARDMDTTYRWSTLLISCWFLSWHLIKRQHKRTRCTALNSSKISSFTSFAKVLWSRLAHVASTSRIVERLVVAGGVTRGPNDQQSVSTP